MEFLSIFNQDKGIRIALELQELGTNEQLEKFDKVVGNQGFWEKLNGVQKEVDVALQ